MPDGVRIAADVWLGGNRCDRRPTILRQTRYFRSIRLRFPFSLAVANRPIDPSGLYSRQRRCFLKAGYAWVDVDVRGSGASTGTGISPWSRPEIDDAHRIVDWIVAQPWSDGNVGAMGISYDGTAAEMLLSRSHPAVKAVAPRFSCYNTFNDIAFPGGIPNTGFSKRWSKLNAALDANRLQDVAPRWFAPLTLVLTSGVSTVPGSEPLREQAVREHQHNFDVRQRSEQIIFADDDPDADQREPEDVYDEDGIRLRGSRLISPSSYRVAVMAGNAAIFGVSGWWDGAYARAAAQRFHATPTLGSRLLLGPWTHDGGWHIEHSNRAIKSRFDHNARLLRFFNEHLRGETSGLSGEPPVRYFTMIESKWKSAETWPPDGVCNRIFYLTADRQLRDQPAVQQQLLSYQQQPVGTGAWNRWSTQAELNGKVVYRDRRKLSNRMLTFRTHSLDRDCEVTGHGVVTLHVACTDHDPVVLVYLEDVDPSGKVLMVTEGGLRARHRRTLDDATLTSRIGLWQLGIPARSFMRIDDAPLQPVDQDSDVVPSQLAELQFDLLPTSYVFRSGHRLQISIATTDVDQFPNARSHTLWLAVGQPLASQVQLPIIA